MKQSNREDGGLSVEFLERTSRVLRLLAHPHRLKIVEILEGRKGGAPVHEIVGRLGLSPAATSQHLNLMRGAGLVASSRRGREVWYRIEDPRSVSILGCLRKGRTS
jgi:ArsR family transcriptional regulator